jgi:predicted Fe-Mo cluster-binding NifX family protein
MRIAIPLAGGRLAQHFGHCEKFALIDVDPAAKSVLQSAEVEAPEHQPGLLPAWLRERGVELVIAGGMGGRALSLFAQESIQVLAGVGDGTPSALVEMYLGGTLSAGANSCDHDGRPHGHGCRH